jgi:hypothetical protein
LANAPPLGKFSNGRKAAPLPPHLRTAPQVRRREAAEA